MRYSARVTTTRDIPEMGNHLEQMSISSLITTMVTVAATSVGLTTFGQHDVVLLPRMILRDTIRGSACLTTLPQQEQPQSQMSSQAYANYAMGPPHMFLIQS